MRIRSRSCIVLDDGLRVSFSVVEVVVMMLTFVVGPVMDGGKGKGKAEGEADA